MNAMTVPTQSSPRLFIGLLSSALAACSGAGQDGLVTVGVRPTDKVAAASGTPMGSTVELPMPGSDEMNQVPDGIGTAAQGVAGSGASAASAGSFATVGTATVDQRRGAAGAAGAEGSATTYEDVCGAIPLQSAGQVTSARATGSSLIEYDVGARNMFTSMRTTLLVPAEPAPNGQIYVWAGLQPTPSATNLQTIGNGALLSALAWGPLCPTVTNANYSSWSMVSMYSNLSSSDPTYSGCHVGNVAMAEAEHTLDIDIHLEGTTWIQHLVNRDTKEVSDFRLDLKGQAQGRAIFAIDMQTNNRPTEDLVFTHTVMSMDAKDADACEPVIRGTSDFASKPRISADGRHCCIDRIVLRASGVAPTTVDPP
jgi:hypothetical protein